MATAVENSSSYIFEEGKERLDAFLSRQTGESREFIKLQVTSGRVQVNGATATKPSTRLQPGDQIDAVLVPLPPPSVEPVEGPLDIMFEDEHLLVLNKPQGIAVHPAPGLKADTLVNYLLFHLANGEYSQLSDTRPGIVHRLDIGTSGVLLVAKQRRAQDHLSRQFEQRSIKKEYEAIVWGQMSQVGRFESSIGRHIKDRKRMSSHTHQGRDAQTDWQRISLLEPCFTHVRLMPKTGRTHQLRVHLTEAGYPIVGDSLYIRRAAFGLVNKLSPRFHAFLNTVKFPFLHAKKLELEHPVTGAPLVFEAPRPAKFDNLLTMLAETDKTR